MARDWAALVALAFRFHGRLRTIRGSVYAAALVLGLGLEAMYAVLAGTKHMMYAYRLFVPYLPSVVLLSLPALPSSATPADGGPPRSAWTFTLIVYQALFALVLVQLMIMPDILLVENYRTMSNLALLDTITAIATA